jgi:2-polyprenyl-6-methoxyphenol hydroxylase-like FAD-dependent oxidoreductase
MALDARLSAPVGIVGGGPVGLFLALALVRAGVAAQVFERRCEGRPASRSIGIHPPSLELLAGLGLADRFVARGVMVRSAEAHSERGLLGRLHFGGCRPPYRYVLTVPQAVTEELLRAALEERAPGSVETREVVGVESAKGEVATLRLAALGGEAERQQERRHYAVIVGCDGKSSVVRQSLGVGFVGGDYPGQYTMADFPDATSLGTTAAIYLGRQGVLESFPLTGGLRRWVARCIDGEHPGTEALVAHVRARAGLRLDPSQAVHPSSFRAQRFQAARFATGRVALAGDAAQVVSPIGGQGMNLGWLGASTLAATIASNLTRGDDIARALARDGRARQRIATAAARRAELNMWLSRPVARPWMRDALVSRLLGTPARWILARLFTMRGLALGC